MKVLDLKTGKGDFVIIDVPKFKGNFTDPQPTTIDWDLTTLSVQDLDTGNYVWNVNFRKPVEFVGYVKEMTERQFSEVVDISFDTPRMHRDYVNNMPGLNARQSFETLIKSLGCYLFTNPVKESIKSLPLKDKHYRQTEPAWIDAENNTFFNPILLKKL